MLLTFFCEVMLGKVAKGVNNKYIKSIRYVKKSEKVIAGNMDIEFGRWSTCVVQIIEKY